MPQSYTIDPPKESLVDRAVEIWKQLLANPEYDNGDRGLTGAFGSSLAGQVPSNATPERLEDFGRVLKRMLLNPGEVELYSKTLAVDYGPGAMLKDAAEEVGLEMEWPWKTNVMIGKDYVAVSRGHSADFVYHYPLSDGRWLLTKLRGKDIDKVIDYVEGGSPDFTIKN